jgi:C1A family cysteine protease
MQKIKISFLYLTLMTLTLQAMPPAGMKHYGFTELSEEALDHLENQTHRIIEVKPNKVGAARIQAHLQSSEPLEAVHSSAEFSTAQVPSATALQMLAISATLPSAVDNSQLPSFPPIGDQQQLGSCVAWGSTYYQASHELGLLNGVNNKRSSQGILSPKWTYDLLNGGQDAGLDPSTAFTLLSVHGAPSIVSFPYDTNYTAWDLNTNDWVTAISNRLGTATAISGLGGSSQNLTAIKQALTNGHVLTFATYVNSWVFTRIKTDPQRINNLHVGEYAAYWMNGSSGGHFMTIVGYDDTLWIDVNQNNSVDSGERGAFLIANSWGSSWGNSGFIWISYDAFLSASAVVNGPSRGRVSAGSPLNNEVIAVVPKAANYSPQLIAEFALSQTLRNQISVQAGVSNTTQTTPATQLAIPALSNSGGAMEFNGVKSTIAQTATFAVDMTDFIPSGSTPATQRYYLICKDSTSGNSTTLSQFSLIDLSHRQTLSLSHPPGAFDHTTVSSYIDYDFADDIGTLPPLPAVSITSPANSGTISGTAQFTVSATSSAAIASVQLKCDSTALATDSSAPYLFSIDTTKLSNGSHTFIAIATDSSNQTSQSTLTLTVQNSAPPAAIYINAGGPTVSYSGTSWAADSSYVSSSFKTSKTSLSTINPIYQTERTGNMTYNIAVPNGTYLVTLKFIENDYKATKHRIFNVSINGSPVISKLDLYATAGARTPYDRTFAVTATNKQISIVFGSLAGAPTISGIQIVPN